MQLSSLMPFLERLRVQERCKRGAKCQGALNTKSEHMGCGALEARQRRLWKGFCECLASVNAKVVVPDAATSNRAVVGV